MAMPGVYGCTTSTITGDCDNHAAYCRLLVLFCLEVAVVVGDATWLESPRASSVPAPKASQSSQTALRGPSQRTLAHPLGPSREKHCCVFVACLSTSSDESVANSDILSDVHFPSDNKQDDARCRGCKGHNCSFHFPLLERD